MIQSDQSFGEISSDLFANRHAYHVLGLMYLLLSDFWLVQVVFHGNILALFSLMLFVVLFIISKESFVFFEIDHPIIFALVGFGLLLFVNMVLGRGVTGGVVFSRYLFLLTYFFVGQIVCSGFGFRIFILGLAGPFLFQALVALPTLLVSAGNSFSLSEMMLQSEGGALLGSKTYLWGVGSYTLYSAMALLAPFCLSMLFELKGAWKLLWTIGVVALFLNILLAGYLNPILQLALGLSILAILHFRARALVLVVVVMAALGIIFQSIPIIKTVLDKAISIFSIVTSSGIIADPTGRGYLATISLETFRANWLFGVGPYEFGAGYMNTIGGHSTVFDWPAQYGIFSLLFIWLVFREIWKAGKTFRKNQHVWFSRSILAFLGAVVVASFLNPLFLKGSLDLVVFSLLGALFSENKVTASIG